MVIFQEAKSIDGIPFVHVMKTISIPLSLYLYLPISALLFSARWSWGDCSSIQGILTHVLRSEYGTFSLASGSEGKSLDIMLIHNLIQLKNDFGFFGLVAGLIGFIMARVAHLEIEIRM